MLASPIIILSNLGVICKSSGQQGGSVPCQQRFSVGSPTVEVICRTVFHHLVTSCSFQTTVQEPNWICVPLLAVIDEGLAHPRHLSPEMRRKRGAVVALASVPPWNWHRRISDVLNEGSHVSSTSCWGSVTSGLDGPTFSVDRVPLVLSPSSWTGQSSRAQ